MESLSVHMVDDPEVVNVVYYKHQSLEVIISPDHRSYPVNIYFDEVLESGDMVERDKYARAITMDEVPEGLIDISKKIILQYLADNRIIVTGDTKFV